jgi:hypothetical protein
VAGMNIRLLPAMIIGAVLALAIGYSVHELSGGGLFREWVRLDADDVVVWLIGGIIVAVAATFLKGKASS